MSIVDKLKAAVTDWDGSAMVDGEPPREILNCGDLREAIRCLEQPTAQSILGWIADLRQSVDSGGGNLIMAKAIIEQAVRELSRA